MGIAAGFIPAVVRHLNPSRAGYKVYRRLHEFAEHGQWVSVPDAGMFGLDGELSPEGCCITATFLALGVFLIATHSVQRMAIRRGFAMLLAGTVVLIFDVVRAQPMFGPGEMTTTLYIGFYVVAALAAGLLILGAIALQFALTNSNPDADAQAVKFLRRKLHSLWQSALSLCVGSRVERVGSHSTETEQNDAHLSGATLAGGEPVSPHTDLPATTPKTDAVGGSQIMSVPSTSKATSALPHEELPKAARFAMKVAKAVLLTVFTCCLFLFLGYHESTSAGRQRIEVGFPSPWFEAENYSKGFYQRVNLLTWSWVIAALGALSCSLYGAIRKRETARLTALEKLASRGWLLWLLIVTFAYIVVAIRAFLMMNHEPPIAHKDALRTVSPSIVDAAKNDVESIQGTWVVTSLEEHGKQLPVNVVIKMVFQGDKVKTRQEDQAVDKEEDGTFLLDPTQKPKAIDLVMGGKRAPGIYTLEAERLTICLNMGKDGRRPTKFATDAKTDGWRLMVLKRQQTDKERIQGTWVAVSAEHNGRKAPEGEVKKIAMTFQGDNVKVKGLKKKDEEEEGTFRLDSTQKPKWVDLAVANKRMPGIYMLEADCLTICFNQNEAGERPKTFATDRETELSLVVLKRPKP